MGNGLQTVHQLRNGNIRRVGRLVAVVGITELAARLRCTADRDRAVRGIPLDQRVKQGPGGRDRVFLNAAQFRIVHAVIIVGVERDLGHQVIPALDVQPPPGRVNILRGRIPADRLRVVDHRHGQEIQPQEVLFISDLEIGKACFGILRHIRDRHVAAEAFVQRLIVSSIVISVQDHRGELTVPVDLQRIRFGFCRFLFRGHFPGGCFLGRRFRLGGCFPRRCFHLGSFAGLSPAGSKLQDQQQGQRSRKEFLHGISFILSKRRSCLF